MLPWMASVFCSFQGQVEGRAGYYKAAAFLPKRRKEGGTNAPFGTKKDIENVCGLRFNTYFVNKHSLGMKILQKLEICSQSIVPAQGP